MNQTDEKLAAETVASATPAENKTLSEEHTMTVQRSKASIALRNAGVPIEGMQDLPASMMALPYVKLVQRMTTKAKLTDGEDAKVGTYYFTDTQESVSELELIILRTKVVERDFIDDKGESKHSTQLFSLCIRGDMEKMFILILPVTSFTPFGRLIAKFKEMKLQSAWEHMVKATTEDAQNKRGQAYKIANLQIGRKLTPDEVDKMAELYGEYGGVLERRDIVEDGEVE